MSTLSAHCAVLGGVVGVVLSDVSSWLTVMENSCLLSLVTDTSSTVLKLSLKEPLSRWVELLVLMRHFLGFDVGEEVQEAEGTVLNLG